MGEVLSRTKWNNIIRQINDLIAHKSADCPTLTPLTEVSPGHKWSLMDIWGAQNTLTAICKDNKFGPLDPSRKWKQVYLNEIRTAISKGWCGCGQWTGPYRLDFPYQSAIRDEVQGTDSWTISDISNYCQANSQIWPITGATTNHRWNEVVYWPAQDLQVGPAGITGRVAKFHVRGAISWSWVLRQWINGGFEDNSNAGELPLSQDGSGWAVGENGYLHLGSEIDLTPLYNLFQDTSSNCPSFEFHTENYQHYNITDAYLTIERP
jgi:hypothetical protein